MTSKAETKTQPTQRPFPVRAVLLILGGGLAVLVLLVAGCSTTNVTDVYELRDGSSDAVSESGFAASNDAGSDTSPSSDAQVNPGPDAAGHGLPYTVTCGPVEEYWSDASALQAWIDAGFPGGVDAEPPVAHGTLDAGSFTVVCGQVDPTRCNGTAAVTIQWAVDQSCDTCGHYSWPTTPLTPCLSGQSCEVAADNGAQPIGNSYCP